ncbi:MAG: response regulator transcription factor [Ruminococcaceae bacterium]|nr:response regulator transcription factor [Oscillospiraceae bacterium]
MDKKILVVDDERPIVEILKINLQKEGYVVFEAFDGEDAVNKAMMVEPNLILLDVMLPKLDGFSVLKKIREKSSVPILMLTAREEEFDKVLGLELGADDYITKPFSIRELMARVKANMRRTETEFSDRKDKELEKLEIGCFVLDYNRYELYKNGKLLDITIREFDLVKFLAGQPNKVFSRQSLLESVWGYEYYGDDRTVDVTVRRLREKVEDDPSEPRYIMTKRGVGYYFQP